MIFELLSLIIIERGGEDKRTPGLGGGVVEAPREKALEQRGSGQEKSHLCDRKRKRREKNSGRCSRTETNGKTGRIKERERKETTEERGRKEEIKQEGLMGDERKLTTRRFRAEQRDKETGKNRDGDGGREDQKNSTRNVYTRVGKESSAKDE